MNFKDRSKNLRFGRLEISLDIWNFNVRPKFRRYSGGCIIQLGMFDLVINWC